MFFKIHIKPIPDIGIVYIGITNTGRTLVYENSFIYDVLKDEYIEQAGAKLCQVQVLIYSLDQLT